MKFCFHIFRVIFYIKKKLTLLTVNRPTNNVNLSNYSIFCILTSFDSLILGGRATVDGVEASKYLDSPQRKVDALVEWQDEIN